jgi:hypothetical protein
MSFQVKRLICLNIGEPSSKARYGVLRNSEKSREENCLIVVL